MEYEEEYIELTDEKFENLDLDPKTKKVLKDKGYVYLTNVQSKVLPLALQGKNLVVQSPTGSGKTLCFLLPAIKLLFEEGYSGNLPADASLLGCISLAPTRELASQSAIQMRDLADPLKLNAGCCIGGIRDKYDKANAHGLHILTGTPGRISALMSSHSIPDTTNVKLLILDEADRLLDSGFRDKIIEIVEALPSDIQIMLFSATIKSSLKSLCDDLLKGTDYEMVCMKGDADIVSESKLRQEFLCVPQSLKLTSLYHILSKNQTKRIIVFLPTCKHVRFVYEVFKRLIPAIPMTELHGKQSQIKRMEQFTRFAAKQNFGCIFTSDVIARGIDFPAVDLVIQTDLPDTVQTYIHRVGRTGRLTIQGTRSFGRGVILVTENQMDFIHSLKKNNIKLHDQTKLIKPLILKKESYVLRKLQAILAKETWIKEMAQRATIAYLRYLNTRANKPDGNEIVTQIQQLALSMGLPKPPLIHVDQEGRGQGKKSKLDKFKRRKKEKRIEDTVNKSPSPTASDDDFLRKNDNVEDDLERSKHIVTEIKDEKLFKASLVSSRKRLRLNRRGDAKLRGLITLQEAEKNHTFFSDDEEEAAAIEEDGKSNYINQLKTQLSKTAEEDKIRESQRRLQRKLKMKQEKFVADAEE